MPKASVATWRASVPTPGSSSTRCRSRGWITSKAFRRPSPSSRSTPATRPAARSARSPRSTITCGSWSRDSAGRYCPACDLPVGTQTADEIIDKIMQRPAGTRLYLMAPLEIEVGEKYEALWEEMRGRRIRPRADRRPDPHARPAAADRPAAKAPRRSGYRPRYRSGPTAAARVPARGWPAAWRMPWPRDAACCT